MKDNKLWYNQRNRRHFFTTIYLGISIVFVRSLLLVIDYYIYHYDLLMNTWWYSILQNSLVILLVAMASYAFAIKQCDSYELKQRDIG